LDIKFALLVTLVQRYVFTKLVVSRKLETRERRTDGQFRDQICNFKGIIGLVHDPLGNRAGLCDNQGVTPHIIKCYGLNFDSDNPVFLIPCFLLADSTAKRNELFL